MYELNDKIRGLAPYEPIQGEYSIRLDANESFVPAPESVLNKLTEAAAVISYNRYPDPLAAELCRAFARHYGVDEACVTAGNGSDELISVVTSSFLMRGERVMVAEPDFSMYRFYASLAETEIISCPKSEDFTINIDRMMETARQENVRMILFSNPCNPTSLGLKREDVRHLISSVDALVVLDEAYMDFWDQSMLAEVEQYDNLMILRTCSKAFGMAALRLGFAVANRTLTRALRAVKSPYNVNSFTQAAGTAVLQAEEETANALRQILASKEELAFKLKQLEQEYPGKVKAVESCTNFIWLRVSEAEQVFHSLLECGIAVRQMEDYLRITAGTHEENNAVCENLSKILSLSLKMV